MGTGKQARGVGKDRVGLETRWVWAGELPLGGLAPADLKALVPLATRAHRQIRIERERGRMGFYDLANEGTAHWKASRRLAGRLVGPAITDVLVLGIGGSALGAKALQRALAPQTIPGSPLALEKTPRKKAGRCERLWVLDNIDPATVLPVLGGLDPARTLVNVVSKSGGTVETAAQLHLFADRFRKKLGPAWTNHFVFTTDPEQGELRRLGGRLDIAMLDIPPDVGGRYSVLSPVGLFPAACMGIAGAELLRGAQAMRMRCELAEVQKNPAYFFAAVHCALRKKQGVAVSVLFPYADALGELGRWFCQLWAESLGKRKSRTGKTVHAGFTPVLAAGATDQHSQLQLYMEGPRDKLVTLVSVEDLGKDAKVPGSPTGKKKDAGGGAFLAGQELGALMAAEREATKAALAGNGVPLFDLRVARLDAHAMGELIVFFEIAAVFLGEILGVNPLDQPGVEEGKRYASALLGRPGFEDLTRGIEPYRKIDKKWMM